MWHAAEMNVTNDRSNNLRSIIKRNEIKKQVFNASNHLAGSSVNLDCFVAYQSILTRIYNGGV